MKNNYILAKHFRKTIIDFHEINFNDIIIFLFSLNHHLFSDLTKL